MAGNTLSYYEPNILPNLEAETQVFIMKQTHIHIQRKKTHILIKRSHFEAETLPYLETANTPSLLTLTHVSIQRQETHVFIMKEKHIPV